MVGLVYSQIHISVVFVLRKSYPHFYWVREFEHDYQV
jgi:hypothetical protein